VGRLACLLCLRFGKKQSLCTKGEIAVRRTHRITQGLAAILLAVASVLVVFPQTAGAAEAWTCPSGGDPQRWDPGYMSTPVPPVYVWNRKIELRYHSSARCAWGRISTGNPGDSVWVDWSSTGGRDWKQLSVTRIPSGGTQVYTTAYNDRGYVMRACGKAGDRSEIVCTRWY